jgi:hypothetical protein
MTIALKLTIVSTGLFIFGALIELVLLFRELQQLQAEIREGMIDFEGYSNGAWSLMFSEKGGWFLYGFFLPFLGLDM